MRRASAKRVPFVLGFPRKKKADVQSEPNLACWGAVCAGADWSLSTFAPTPTNCDFTKKKTIKLRTALECISSRAITMRLYRLAYFRIKDTGKRHSKQQWFGFRTVLVVEQTIPIFHLSYPTCSHARTVRRVLLL